MFTNTLDWTNVNKFCVSHWKTTLKCGPLTAGFSLLEICFKKKSFQDMIQQLRWTFLSVGFEKLHQAWHSSCTEAAPQKSRNTKIITEHLVQQVEHLLVRDAFIMAGCHARPCHACIYDPLIQDFKILEKCDSLRVLFFYTPFFCVIQATHRVPVLIQ